MSNYDSNYSIGEYLFSLTRSKSERYFQDPKYYKMNSKIRILKENYSNITINQSPFTIHDDNYIYQLEHSEEFLYNINNYIKELKDILDLEEIMNTEQEINSKVIIDKVSNDTIDNTIQIETALNNTIDNIQSSVDNKVIPNKIISSQKSEININKLNDIDKYRLLKKNPEYIKYLNNPSTSIQEYLINMNPINIQYIESPSASLKMKAIRKNPYSILYINNLNIKKLLRNVKYYSNNYINQLSDQVSYKMSNNVNSLDEFDMIEEKATNIFKTNLIKYYLENNYFIKCKIKSDNIYCIYFYGQWLIQVNNNSNLTIDEYVARYYNNIDYLSLLNVMEYYHKHDMTIYKMVI